MFEVFLTGLPCIVEYSETTSFPNKKKIIRIKQLPLKIRDFTIQECNDLRRDKKNQNLQSFVLMSYFYNK